jgi:3'(2'), 5'-bisphosphate nucleotidase
VVRIYDPAALTSIQLVDELTTIVSRAAAAILAIDPATAARRIKSDLSPVSAADEASNSEIIKGLSCLLPGMPIVSEESIGPSSAAPLGPSFALVDPLDGTREFLAGRNEFTANIALVIDDIPTVGVIAAPALGLIWRGIVGRDAERLRLSPGAAADEADEIVAIHTRRRPAQGLIAAVSRSHFDAETAALLASLPVGVQIACGSSIKFCQVADGSADIYARLAPTHEWDIAAGHAIVTAAGGTVMTPEGKRLTYGRAAEGFCVPAFLAFGDPEMANAMPFHVGQ